MNLRNKTIIALLCLSLGWTANAQTNAVQKYVEQLKTTEELKDAVWGVKVAKADGSVLVEYNSNKRMLPASNLKLITTGLALNELGPDYKFTTRLAYSGSVEDGVLKGDLYIIGGGDPTIGMRDSVAFQLQKTFSEWASMLRKAGISHIDGRIIGDGRYFDGEDQNLSWQLEDSYCGDGSAMSALSFYGNLLDTRVAPGKSLGSPVQVEPLFPELPWMNWRNTCVTAAKGEGNDLYFLCTTLAPVASMSGTYALDQPAKRLTCANPFGAMTCAYYFYRYLENEGILAAEGPADIDASGNIRDFEQEAMQPARAQRSLTVIGESRSPALKDIVRETNYRSDNFYAETLLRTLALEKTGSARYDSCAVAESSREAGSRSRRLYADNGRKRSGKEELCFSCILRAVPDSNARHGCLQGLSEVAAAARKIRNSLYQNGFILPRGKESNIYEERKLERSALFQRIYTPELGQGRGYHHLLGDDQQHHSRDFPYQFHNG